MAAASSLVVSDGAQPHCVGLTDLVTGDDGSSMAAGFMQWENAFFPWTLNYDEIDMVLEGSCMFATKAKL